MSRLDDFLVEDLEALSMEEFVKGWGEKMKFFLEKYMESHDGKLPRCYPCSKPIETSDNLVRYLEKSLHNKCFLQEYDGDFLDLSTHDKRYYGLVKKAIENAPRDKM